MSSDIAVPGGSAVSEGGLDRRTLLKAGAASAVGLGALGLGASLGAQAASAATSIGKAGPKRKLVWVVHELGVWNFPFDVAFRDFCDLAGWSYQKIGSTAPGSLETDSRDLTNAILAKPDIIVTTMVYDGIVPLLKRAMKSVKYFAINQSFNEPLIKKSMPDYFGGFIGEIPEISGGTVMEGLLRDLTKNGKRSGVVPIGDPVIGNTLVDKRVKAMKDVMKKWNAANGTTFTSDLFDDKSLDIAQSVPIYKTKIREHGSKLAGFASLGNYPATACIQAMKELKIGPGKFPIASIDTAPVTNQGIKEGYVLFIYDNQYYTQAFVPATQAWAYLERGFRPIVEYPTGAIVDKKNINAVIKRDNFIVTRAKQLGIAKG